MIPFETINPGFNSVFKPEQLSIGIVIPIENYTKTKMPTMASHLERVVMVEQLGFKAVWVRDVPLHVPSFGDAGQMFDPFTYLGYLAGQTSEIALGVASIALPLHHPIHVAKSAATIDQLSGGRLILGVASGDRSEEYPAMNIDYENRGELFRQAFQYIRTAQKDFPISETNTYGSMDGRSDVLPKATGHKIPMLITGNSRQSIKWIAEHGDGWMYYPRNLYMQDHNITEWRNFVTHTSQMSKPFMQSLYVDLHEDDDFKPQGIHLGWRLGANHLLVLLKQLRAIGVNHVAINLRLNTEPIEKTLTRLAIKVLPHFHFLNAEV